MAREKSTEKHAWDRLVIWMRRNQRIIWVLLLILVCFSFGFVGPVQDFFMKSPELGTVAVVYGKRMTQVDWQQTQDRLGAVASVLQRAWLVDFSLPDGLMNALRVGSQTNPLDFAAFREKADRVGLRVSDKELADAARLIWEKLDGLQLAAEEVRLQSPAVPKDSQEEQRLQSQVRTLAKEKEKELQSQPFDVGSWERIIAMSAAGRGTRLLPNDFEAALRDAILVGKLEEYVRDTVQVTPQAVFEEFQKQEERRRLSWVEYPLTDALKEKVAKTVTPEQVRVYFEQQKSTKEIELPARIKGRWLLVPKEHFRKLVEAKITDADLKEYFKRWRNDYRRPAVLPDEASFIPRTAAQEEQLQAKLYYSLDEVKDKVREKVIEERTRDEMQRFASTLRERLYPAKPAAGETAPAPAAATFADLIKEYAFLEAGSTDYVTQDTAEKGFGDGYGPEVKRWFDMAARDPTKVNLKAPERPVNGDKGMVFYAGLDYRAPMAPILQEVEAKVHDIVAKKETLRLLQKAAEEVSSKINSKQEEFSAAGALQVEVGGEKVEVAPKPVETALSSVGRTGTLSVPKRPEEKTKEGEATPGEEETGDESKEGEETNVASSREIVDAGFRPKGIGETSVALSEATDAVYLVRVDATVPPDSKDFEGMRSRLELKLTGEQQNAYFEKGRAGVRAEAGIQVREEPRGEAEDRAAS